MPSTEAFLLLSALMFTIGLVGVTVRRNMITVLMCLELMLNAVNINLVAFSQRLSSLLQHFERELAGAAFARQGFHLFKHLRCDTAPAMAGRHHYVMHVDQRTAGKSGKAFDRVDESNWRGVVECQHAENERTGSECAGQVLAGKIT